MQPYKSVFLLIAWTMLAIAGENPAEFKPSLCWLSLAWLPRIIEFCHLFCKLWPSFFCKGMAVEGIMYLIFGGGGVVLLNIFWIFKLARKLFQLLC